MRRRRQTCPRLFPQRQAMEVSDGNGRGRSAASDESSACNTSAKAGQMSKELASYEVVQDFRQVLIRSRNYYGHLWARYSRCLRLLWFVEAFAGLLVITTLADLNGIVPRIVLFLGIVLPATKKVLTLPIRIEELNRQYHETCGILADLERTDAVSMEDVVLFKARFKDVEKLDKPTNQCLMAVCANEAFVAMGVKKEFVMTWWERHVDVYLGLIDYDSHARLIDVNR